MLFVFAILFTHGLLKTHTLSLKKFFRLFPSVFFIALFTRAGGAFATSGTLKLFQHPLSCPGSALGRLHKTMLSSSFV
jgi:ABC-type phosphate/phosphonate transport system permease subunit